VPNPIGVMFVLYIVVSIVSGIVSSVLKQSRPTARRRRPVHVPGPQIPYPAEVDVSELEEQPGPAADEGHADWTVIEEHVGSAVGEGDPHWTAVRGRLGPTVTGGYSGSAELGDYPDSAAVEGPRQMETIKRLQSASEREGRHESLKKGLALSTRSLFGDREQLRAMIIATEILGKPKGLSM